MNWTGGHLQQTKRQQNNITAKQRSYFAKSHRRIAADKHKPGIGSLDHHSSFLQSLRPYRQERVQQELEPPEWLPKELWSSFLQTKSPQQVESVQTSGSHGSRNRQHNHTTIVEDVLRDYSEDSKIPQTSEELEHETKRRNLLLRKDWFATSDWDHNNVSVASYCGPRIGKRRKLRQDDHARAALLYKTPVNRPGLAAGIGNHALQPSQISVRFGSQIHGTQRTRISNPKALANTISASRKPTTGSQDPCKTINHSAQVPQKTSASTIASFQALEEIATPPGPRTGCYTQGIEIERWISASVAKGKHIERTRLSRAISSESAESLYRVSSESSRDLPQSARAWSIEVNCQSEKDDDLDNQSVAFDYYHSTNPEQKKKSFLRAKEEHIADQGETESHPVKFELEREHVALEESTQSALGQAFGIHDNELTVLPAPISSKITGTSTFTWSTSENQSPRRSLIPHQSPLNGEVSTKSDQEHDGASFYYRTNGDYELGTQSLHECQPPVSPREHTASVSIETGIPSSNDFKSMFETQQSTLLTEDRRSTDVFENLQHQVPEAATQKSPLRLSSFHPNFETPITQQCIKVRRPWTPVKTAVPRKLPVKREGTSDTATINLIPKFREVASMLTKTQIDPKICRDLTDSAPGFSRPPLNHTTAKSIVRSMKALTGISQQYPITFVKPQRFEADAPSKMRIGAMISPQREQISTGKYS